ncbi:LuxR C-terminal-related transcriptional regulator [Eubacteriales bacterium OttesenSCG-928-M02]|nr:LuxR C-terminal-related transcriptional regulator [Eubacteriales bacterium OttesenSCG-928-M02]
MQRQSLLREKWVLPRPHVHHMLEEGLSYPAIFVVAGPGYGKTTTVASFAKQVDRRLIWMHLMHFDNDVDRFWRRYRDEMRHELPEVAEMLEAIEFPATLALFDDYLRIITREGYRSKDVLLVFDNIERIENPAIQEFIYSMLRVELENLCVVLIGEERPHPSFLSRGKYRHIGAQDLRYNEEEIISLFAYHNHQLEPNEATHIHSFTDGWPLALHMLAAQMEKDSQASIDDLPFQRSIAELFEENYYRNFDTATQKALVFLSLLPCATRGLLKAIGLVDSDQVFSTLLQNPFISYNFSNEMLYFQQMYSEFLAQKGAHLSDEVLASLYSAAGNYYRDNGFFREALECFWHIQDYDRFCAIIQKPPTKWIHVEFTNWVLDKLNQFPPDYVLKNPSLDYSIALLLINDGKVLRAKDLLSAFIGRLEEKASLTEEEKTSLAKAYAVMADVAILQNTFDGFSYMQKALALSPTGVTIRAKTMLVAGNNEIFFLPGKEPDTLAYAMDMAKQMVPLSQRLFHENGMGYFDLYLAEGAFLSGAFADAWEHSTKALYDAKYAQQHDIVGNALSLQMRMHLFLGDAESALPILTQLEEYITSNAPHELSGLRDCAKAFYYLHLGDVEKVPLWLTGNENLPTDIPLAIGRDRVVCASYLYSTGKYDRAYTTLMELDRFYEENKQWSIQLNASILKAACLIHMGNPPRTMEFFHRAYTMTWQNGLDTPFIEFGAAVLALLDAAEAQDQFAFDAEWMKTIRNAVVEKIKQDALMQKQYRALVPKKKRAYSQLTPRETQVFSYWAQGFSREEIANILSISIHGVKKHISNIYLKLDAVNRLDAIHIGKANGLLEDI